MDDKARVKMEYIHVTSMYPHLEAFLPMTEEFIECYGKYDEETNNYTEFIEDWVIDNWFKGCSFSIEWDVVEEVPKEYVEEEIERISRNITQLQLERETWLNR